MALGHSCLLQIFERIIHSFHGEKCGNEAKCIYITLKNIYHPQRHSNKECSMVRDKRGWIIVGSFRNYMCSCFLWNNKRIHTPSFLSLHGLWVPCTELPSPSVLSLINCPLAFLSSLHCSWKFGMCCDILRPCTLFPQDKSYFISPAAPQLRKQ